MSKLRSKQQGVTLIIGMIFLVILTLAALASFNLGKLNFVVTSNMQQRSESVRAVEQVLDEIVDNDQIKLSSAALFGSGNTRAIDINGDGTTDVTVTVATPVCRKIQVIKQATLDLSKADDLGCSAGVVSSAAGIENATTADSLCSDVVWEVTATGVQAWETAKVVSVVGIGQRGSTNDASKACY